MTVQNEKYHAAGQTFMQAVLAKLPEELRTQVTPLFQGDAVDEALEFAGEGALLRPEASRRMDEADQKEKDITDHWTRLNTWHAGQKDKLAETETLRVKVAELQGGNGSVGGTPPKPGDPTLAAKMTREELLATIGLDPATIVTAEQLTEVIGNVERGMLSFYQQASPIAIEHYKTFGDVLDTEAVLAHPKVREIGFRAAYLDLHKDKFEQQAKAAQETHDKEVGEAAVSEHIKANAGAQWPIPGRSMPSGITSPLDALEVSMRTPPAGEARVGPDGKPVASTAPGPGHTNLADDGALVDRAVEQFLQRAQELGRPVARV